MERKIYTKLAKKYAITPTYKITTTTAPTRRLRAHYIIDPYDSPTDKEIKKYLQEKIFQELIDANCIKFYKVIEHFSDSIIWNAELWVSTSQIEISEL